MNLSSLFEQNMEMLNCTKNFGIIIYEFFKQLALLMSLTVMNELINAGNCDWLRYLYTSCVCFASYYKLNNFNYVVQKDFFFMH